MNESSLSQSHVRALDLFKSPRMAKKRDLLVGIKVKIYLFLVKTVLSTI